MNFAAIGFAITSALAIGTSVWFDRIADSSTLGIYLAADKPQAGEPVSATRLRAEVMKNWRELGAIPESSHPKGDQLGTGVLRTELKPDSTEVLPVESNREAKRDKERQASQLEGFSIACKEGVCEKKDPIAFKVIPFDSPRAIKGSLD